jgi:hypothetical protein
MGWFGGGGGSDNNGAPSSAAPPARSALADPPAAAPPRASADAVIDAVRELAAPRPLAPPPLEPQPWVKETWRRLSASSVGVARLDLRRPQFLDVEAYDNKNIMYTRPGAVRRGPGRPRTRPTEGIVGGFLGPVGEGAGGARRRRGGGEPAFVLGTAGALAEPHGDGHYDDDAYYSSPSGARLKIMRCWQLRPKGNDLEGARRVEEAAAKKQGSGWRSWGRNTTNNNNNNALVEPPAAPEKGSHMGLELVSNTAAAGAAELFGDDGGGDGDGDANAAAGTTTTKPQQPQRWRELPPPSPKPQSPAHSLRAPRPLLDFGLGASLNLDASRLEPVARLKIAGLVSFHLFSPRPRLKVGRVWRLPGTSMALRLRYECPLTPNALAAPWQPPARLLLRLDNGVGSGVHLSPGGIEFDERRVALGDGLLLRAGATVLFPRSLPMPRGEEALRVRVDRLSVKTLW